MSQIRIRVEMTAVAGRAPELEQIFYELVESVRGESGTVDYGYYRSSKPGTYIVHEHYANSEAAIAHMDALDPARSARMLEISNSSKVEVHGEPSAELRAAIDGFGIPVAIYPPVITLVR